MNSLDLPSQRLPNFGGRRLVRVAFLFSLTARLFAEGEQRFASPDEAMKALATAAQGRDTNALHEIFGPEAHELISPDAVQASDEFEMFVHRIAEKTEMVRESDTKSVLQLGADGWPFPIPLLKQDGQWFFNTPAGKEEILNRRIGMNETGAIRVCRAYVNAQREYASEDRNGDQVLEYAQRLRSLPGSHDGLYWPGGEAGDISPLGPLVAQARVEGYRREAKILAEIQSPYHGYYFKILSKQGRHAPGGRYNYVINGHMIGGFALVAWPAEWGNSGVVTFIVNQQCGVYQKNLGPKTASIASAMKAYDPDSTWALAKDE